MGTTDVYFAINKLFNVYFFMNEKMKKNEFLIAPLRRLLCNALVQPHFDYASSAWYPNLSKKMLKKLSCSK